MPDSVQIHYQKHPYPVYPLLASVRRCDTYALNLDALWARFNHTLPPPEAQRILIAGCGTFAPYPWAVSNPKIPITALDLSQKSLRRARLHCILHGRRNVVYRCGDLTDQTLTCEKFGLIDSYGVLHHLKDPLTGLRRLEQRLIPGGILRIMLYSRYARREEESIRRAFKLLGINTASEAQHLIRKAKPGSRLAHYMATSDEPTSISGLADALLHPCVHTYRIDDIIGMIDQTGLELLMFAHNGAKENPSEEIKRLKSLEKQHCSPGNFVLYLGKDIDTRHLPTPDSKIMLNPCLTSAVNPFRPGTMRIPAKTGITNPPLTYAERRFLRRFTTPVYCRDIPTDEADLVTVYKRALFLLEYE